MYIAPYYWVLNNQTKKKDKMTKKSIKNIIKNLVDQSSKVLLLLVILIGLLGFALGREITNNDTIIYCVIMVAVVFNRVSSRNSYSISVAHKDSSLNVQSNKKEEEGDYGHIDASGDSNSGNSNDSYVDNIRE